MKEYNFNPKQWVLVRDSEKEKWSLARYSHYDANCSYPYRMILNVGFKYCVPYDGNEKLLGEYEDAYKPKDGDFVYIETDWNKIVYIHHYIDDDGRIYSHAQYCLGGTAKGFMNVIPESDLNLTWTKDVIKIRPANDSEKRILLDNLLALNKKWNSENKIIEYSKWKPKPDERFFYVNSIMIADFSYWIDDSQCKRLYDIGNCFRTREEAKEMVNKMKELFNNK